MRAMFAMMNHERLWVGMQGLAVSETAYQNAAAYAKDRLQGRSPTGPVNTDGPADPIIVHPDVRRMLMTTRAQLEGARALYIGVALAIDTADRHPDPSVRASADKRVALLTPVIKAYLSDMGLGRCCQLSSKFSVDMAMFVSGAWNNTSVTRALRKSTKAPMGCRRWILLDGSSSWTVARSCATIYRKCASLLLLTQMPGWPSFSGHSTMPSTSLRAVFEWLLETGASDPAAAGAAAVDFLKMMGLTSLAHMWASMAAASLDKVEGDNTGFYARKITLARYFMQRLLPQTVSLAHAVRSAV